MQDLRKPKLQQSGKSKSLDSCDLLSTQTKLSLPKSDNEKVVQKLQEIAEASSCSSAANTLCFKCSNNMNPNENCKRCQPNNGNHNNQNAASSLTAATAKKPPIDKKSSDTPPVRRKFTSFTDSPLFTRKHRFGSGNRGKDANLENSASTRKNENGFSFVKQLSEMRWRRKEAHNNGQNNSTSSVNEQTGTILEVQQSQDSTLSSNNETNGNTIEATPVEAEVSVSLHTQVNYNFIYFINDLKLFNKKTPSCCVLYDSPIVHKRLY